MLDSACARSRATGVIVARQQVRFYQAAELEMLAGYAAATADDEFAYLKIATLLGISGRVAQQRLAFASVVVQRLPRTCAALKDGAIDEYKVRLIADALSCPTSTPRWSNRPGMGKGR